MKKIFTIFLSLLVGCLSLLATDVASTLSSAVDAEGFSYISDFTYAKDLITYSTSSSEGGFYSSQHEDGLNMLKANVFCVERFYGLDEGQSFADFDMYQDMSLTPLGQFNFCWDWYGIRMNEGGGGKEMFDFVKAYNQMSIGDTKKITVNNGVVYTFTLLDKIVSSNDSQKKIIFSVDRPLYFGGNKNGSVGVRNFRERVQVKYVNPNAEEQEPEEQPVLDTIFVYQDCGKNVAQEPKAKTSMPLDASVYSTEGIKKVFSNDNNIDIPMTYLAHQKKTSGSPMNCIVIYSPSGKEYNLYSPNLYETNFSNNRDLIPYYVESNGYIFIDLQSKEAGTWHLKLVQEYAGNWMYYYQTGSTLTLQAEGCETSLSFSFETAEEVTIAAVPSDMYHFVEWSDGVTDNPRTLTVTQDISLTAVFAMTIVDMGVEVRYMDKDNEVIITDSLILHVPQAPHFDGFTFLKWRFVESDITEGLTIQAVYESNDISTPAPEVVVNPKNPAQKLIRDGQVYILVDDKIYTITGQVVR